LLPIAIHPTRYTAIYKYSGHKQLSEGHIWSFNSVGQRGDCKEGKGREESAGIAEKHTLCSIHLCLSHCRQKIGHAPLAAWLRLIDNPFASTFCKTGTEAFMSAMLQDTSNTFCVSRIIYREHLYIDNKLDFKDYKSMFEK
jgi:hypothetical protein